METPPLKTFLFVITFLSIFGILVMTIPSEFIAEGDEYREHSVPDYFEAIDLQAFADTENFTLDAWVLRDFVLGGHDFRLYADREDGDGFINIQHFFWFWFWKHGFHKVEWFNSHGITRGKDISKTELLADYDNTTEVAKYTCKCEHVMFRAWFAYNRTAYNNIVDAWENDDLALLLAIDFDEQATGMNAWNLIGMLLFFQLPNIHPILNMIIAIPIWVAIGWLAFAFIIAVIKSLPFT